MKESIAGSYRNIVYETFTKLSMVFEKTLQTKALKHKTNSRGAKLKKVRY